MGPGERLDGWESRLAAVLHEASWREFDPKAWNCALFAAACVEAVTGRPMPRKLTGSLEQTVDRLFPRIRPSQARRGDVVAAYLPGLTLAVCTGREMAAVGKSGLINEPMSKAVTAWSV